MQAKKSLGQNFLRDSKALHTIVEAVAPRLPVLEIGPGKGALTKQLLGAGHRVVAVEKDDRLIEPLEELFAEEISTGQFTLVHGDALEDTWESMGRGETAYQVVANLPYYITGQYIRRTLESDHQPEHMILLLQQEVVDRIVAADGKESILSIAVKVYGTPRKLAKVKKEQFTPQPKVDSAIIQIADISRDNLNKHKITESDFFAVVRAGFASRRKTLANNLKPYGDIKKHLLEMGLDEAIRAERLTVADWLVLATRLATDS